MRVFTVSQHCWAQTVASVSLFALLRRVVTCWVLKIELLRIPGSTNLAKQQQQKIDNIFYLNIVGFEANIA